MLLTVRRLLSKTALPLVSRAITVVVEIISSNRGEFRAEFGHVDCGVVTIEAIVFGADDVFEDSLVEGLE